MTWQQAVPTKLLDHLMADVTAKERRQRQRGVTGLGQRQKADV
jgi:hypothetical protein